MIYVPDYTGERAVPWNQATGMRVLNAHLARYAWAMQFVYGKTVLDLGCGCGYGADMLSWGAMEITGVDVDVETIEFASRAFQAGNLHFAQMDIERVERLPPAQVYVAFEVLEHLRHPEELIAKIRGTLLWSVPADDGSKFHRHVYSVQQASELLPGSALWYQSSDVIVPRSNSWFEPAHVVGMWRKAA